MMGRLDRYDRIHDEKAAIRGSVGKRLRRVMLDTLIRRGPIRPREVVRILSEQGFPPQKTRDAIWSLIDTGDLEVTPDLKLTANSHQSIPAPIDLI